jgi:hypothetical protein
VKFITGTRFIWKDGDTYEVKETSGGLIRASWVDPDTGKTQRGRPSHFKLADMGDAKIVQEGIETTSAVVRVERYDAPEPKEVDPQEMEHIKNMLSKIGFADSDGLS